MYEKYIGTICKGQSVIIKEDITYILHVAKDPSSEENLRVTNTEPLMFLIMKIDYNYDNYIILIPVENSYQDNNFNGLMIPERFENIVREGFKKM